MCGRVDGRTGSQSCISHDSSLWMPFQISFSSLDVCQSFGTSLSKGIFHYLLMSMSQTTGYSAACDLTREAGKREILLLVERRLPLSCRVLRCTPRIQDSEIRRRVDRIPNSDFEDGREFLLQDDCASVFSSNTSKRRHQLLPSVCVERQTKGQVVKRRRRRRRQSHE